MPGFGDVVKKAFYLGVGLASYAGEKAGGRLTELRSQVEKLADEMVARGEMTTEEGRRFVEDMMKQAKQSPSPSATAEQRSTSEPRLIEILEEESPTAKETAPTENVDRLRSQVQQMQEELRRLQREQG
jgi:polyhydroxyalkanoate synthesis regulator phasin